jgi:hypothetical protein
MDRRVRFDIGTSLGNGASAAPRIVARRRANVTRRFHRVLLLESVSHATRQPPAMNAPYALPHDAPHTPRALARVGMSRRRVFD